MLKDHNAVTPVRLEPATSRPQVKHSTTEPLRSLLFVVIGALMGELMIMSVILPSVSTSLERSSATRRRSMLPSSIPLPNQRPQVNLWKMTYWYIKSRGYKTFYVLNLTEHEISTAHKTKVLKNKDFSCFQTLRCCIYHAHKC